MKHLPHSGELKQVNVKVFQQESKRPSMVLTINKRKELEKDILDLARDFIGKEVCIDWPILKMGLVDSFWAEGNKYTRQDSGEVTAVALDGEEQEVMKSMLYAQKERMLSRYAIDVKNANTIVFVRRYVGVTYFVEQGVLRPQKQWAGPQVAVPVLLPLLVTNVNVEGGVSLRDIPVSEAYPKHSKVFAMLPSWEGFGYPALVDMVDPEGRVRLTVSIWPSVDLSAIRTDYESLSLQWMNSFDAGRKIGVDGRLLSRITGTVFLIIERNTSEEETSRTQEKINIGLSLKLSKRNQEVADYTRRLENGYWQYSMLCVQLLNSYRNKFRDLFAFLENSHSVDDAYLASDVWTNEEKRNQRVADLKEWLSNTPTNGVEKQEGGKKYADRLIIGQIENAIKQVPKKRWGFRKCAVNPSVLYRAELYNGRCCADPDADFQLLDRVVYTVQGSTIPFGSQGTVVGILSGKVDVLFDLEFNSGFKIRGAMNSGACVPKNSLINITYGKERKGRKPTEPPIGSEKRLLAGKENVCLKQKKSASEARSTFNDAPCALLTRKPKEQSVQGTPSPAQRPTEGAAVSPAVSSVISSENAVTSSPALPSSFPIANVRHESLMPLPMTKIISKEQMEDELNRMLGLRTGKSAVTEQSPVSSILSSLTGSAPASAKTEEVPKQENQSPPSALTKLFATTPTQNQNENQEIVQKLLSAVKEEDVAKKNSRPSNNFQRGGGVYRPPTQRRPVVPNRQVLPATTLFPTRPPPLNRDFFGSSRLLTNTPKLTDLKPSSVVLPCRQPLRRRGGKQQSGLTNSPPSQPRDVDTAEVAETPAAPPLEARAPVNKNRRARKSRLAPKFTEGN
ncbi:hypothetical protein ANCCAN_20131 [Ancylostoma caninum]|uniref:Uncharacterized protein n=1 Tax=Ancylostoma caninum TaxID=29170 RepID=A0A368FT89_ANCCA|nr:hypothetical protein ANCCAN_20131 [Ancylostoma caninum]